MSATVVYPIARLPELLMERGGAPVSISTTYNAIAAAAVNTAILAGVTGERIRVLSLVCSSQTGTATSITLRDGSGGTILGLFTIPANSSATPNLILDLDALGWADTTAGAGLYVDVSAAAGVYLSCRLAQFVP